MRRLEELGIGRPSTYAPTISTIINRGIRHKQNKQGTKRSYRLIRLERAKSARKSFRKPPAGNIDATDIGMIVNDYLGQTFSEEILTTTSRPTWRRSSTR